MRKNKIRILHVAQAAGGVDRYIRMLLKYLDKEKFENILICSQDFHEEDYKGLVDYFDQVEMTRAIGSNDLKAIKSVRTLIKKYNPDIVYADANFKSGCYVAPEHPQPGDNLDKLQIYQITKGGCEYRFMNYAYSKSRIHAADYSSVYIANLPADYDLDRCFQEFNAPNRPLRYHMCSLSTSDIVVTTKNGKETAYYVDSIGFKDVSHLLPELHEVEAQRQKAQVQDEPER